MASKSKVRFLFHNADDSMVGRGITVWTGFLALFYNWRVLKYSYSHEEVHIPNSVGKFSTAGKPVATKFFGQCFSSTTRGDADGVRFAPASEVLRHPERWSYIECEVDAERLEVAIQEAQRLVGARYDYWGIIGFLNPFPVQDPKKYFCSEICDWFKVLCRIYPKRQKRVSPRRSAYLLSKKWGEPISLVKKT